MQFDPDPLTKRMSCTYLGFMEVVRKTVFKVTDSIQTGAMVWRKVVNGHTLQIIPSEGQPFHRGAQ